MSDPSLLLLRCIQRLFINRANLLDHFFSIPKYVQVLVFEFPYDFFFLYQQMAHGSPIDAPINFLQCSSSSRSQCRYTLSPAERGYIWLVWLSHIPHGVSSGPLPDSPCRLSGYCCSAAERHIGGTCANEACSSIGGLLSARLPSLSR